ncbi:MAG: hypothetical protein KTR16_07195 [Acidiferrobacterales bacterium]|nr:hypothetical protein [Acidiferrobacterales bacterium]
MKIYKIVLLSTLLLYLSACGGGSDSGASLAEEREALECVDFGNGIVINTCNFNIIVVTFGGTATPVLVPANGTATDPDANVIAGVGACKAPFTPVEVNANEFECL